MENPELKKEVASDVEAAAPMSLTDFASVVLATCGVGYLPLAPGTWGSIVGVAIYLGVYVLEFNFGIYLLHHGWDGDLIESWLYSLDLFLLVAFSLVAIAASTRASRVFGEKDPSRTVVDEVIGQLIVFLFIPLTTTWWMIGAAFLLFRFFDIAKPFPINKLQDLPDGLGVCADDVLAGIFAGITLNIIHSIYLSI